jgi:hypothetical protein
VKTFVITVPENRFEAESGPFVLGVLELKANYKFSQRRTDINDLTRGVIENARAEERALIAKESSDIKRGLLNTTPASLASLRAEVSRPQGIYPTIG